VRLRNRSGRTAAVEDRGGSLLTVEGLTVEFDTDDGVVHAVTDVGFSLDRGDTLAIIGESGSGKSVSVQALMGLVPSPPGRVQGHIRFLGVDLLNTSASELRRLRGARIAMIFQDPLTSLNPVYPVGWQIAEMLRVHLGTGRAAARRSAIELMERVGIPNAAERARDHPHLFSGGMRQRIMIAMALALEPDVLIADEPTTALDVTVQAQIMELLKEVQDQTGMALILITHDLGVVASVADRVLVMYAGRIVETGTADGFYGRPAHPYAQGLLASVPRLRSETERLHSILGVPPSLITLPSGCPFHPRCPHAVDLCRAERPALRPVPLAGRDGTAACHRMEEVS
jgi:oligopeptide transport system ATP-binding protein